MLGQTGADLRVLLVDDGSTDGEVARCATRSRANIGLHPRAAQAQWRRAGDVHCRRSRSRRVTMCSFSTVTTAIRRRRSTGWPPHWTRDAADVNYFGSGGMTGGQRRRGVYTDDLPLHTPLTLRRRLPCCSTARRPASQPGGAPCSRIRASASRPRLGREDLCMTRKMPHGGAVVVILPDVLYLYRQHEGSVDQARARRQRRNHGRDRRRADSGIRRARPVRAV